MTTFGKRLRALREARSTNQADEARALGIAQSTLSSYEVGRTPPDVDLVLKVCLRHDVSADYLLGLPERTASGLRPGDWVVDLDLAEKVGKKQEKWGECRYAWPVPRNHRVMDSVAFDEFERDLWSKKRRG